MTTPEQACTRVQAAIDAIRQGGLVIMVDDEDRENEGDLVFAASLATAEKINFMTKEARGLICLSLEQAAVERLQLPMMEDSGKSSGAKSTAFTVSIEARHGVSTGISAADRAHTICVAASPDAKPQDLVVPGHVFPLKAREGGVLRRAGHTEGSVDLARLAGMTPAAVICEIMNDDGTMARMPDLQRFARRHHLPIVTIADLITFRLQRESLIEEVQRGVLRTAHGDFQALLFASQVDGLSHLALVKSPVPVGEKGAAFFHGDDTVDVRVHRQQTLVDVFSHPQSGGRFRVDYGLRMLGEARAGVLLYLNHAVEATDMLHDFATLTEQRVQPSPVTMHGNDKGMDPFMLGVGAQILRYLGVRRMRVHMTRPALFKGLAGYDLEVLETKLFGTPSN